MTNNQKNKKIITKILDLLDDIRFYIQKDNGDMEFVSYKNGILTIKLLGSCIGCDLIDLTYREGLENILRDEIKEIKKIIIIDPSTNKKR